MKARMCVNKSPTSGWGISMHGEAPALPNAPVDPVQLVKETRSRSRPSGASTSPTAAGIPAVSSFLLLHRVLLLLIRSWKCGKPLLHERRLCGGVWYAPLAAWRGILGEIVRRTLKLIDGGDHRKSGGASVFDCRAVVC